MELPECAANLYALLQEDMAKPNLLVLVNLLSGVSDEMIWPLIMETKIINLNFATMLAARNTSNYADYCIFIMNIIMSNMFVCKDSKIRKRLIKACAKVMVALERNSGEKSEVFFTMLNKLMGEYPEHAVTVTYVLSVFFDRYSSASWFNHGWIGYLLQWFPCIAKNAKPVSYWTCCFESLLRSRALSNTSIYFGPVMQILASLMMESRDIAASSATVLKHMTEINIDTSDYLKPLMNKIFEHGSEDNNAQADKNSNHQIFEVLIRIATEKFPAMVPQVCQMYNDALVKPQTVAQFRMLCNLSTRMPQKALLHTVAVIVSRFFNNEFCYLKPQSAIETAVIRMSNSSTLPYTESDLVTKYMAFTLKVVRSSDFDHVRRQIL